MKVTDRDRRDFGRAVPTPPVDDADLPAGWTVWTEEDGGRLVLAFRPDEFDGAEYPAPCLPTLTVGRRPPTERKRRAGSTPQGWHVALFLEPEVRVRSMDQRCETRTAAVAAAVEAARDFAAGDVDYRAAYQVPRETYLDALDAATGRDA